MANIYDTLPAESKNVYDDVPSNIYDVVPTSSSPGDNAYDSFKVRELKAGNLPSYREDVPRSQNPDYDFTRATQGQTMLAPPIAAVAKLLGSKNPEAAPFQPLVKFPTVSEEDLKQLPGPLNTVGRAANAVTGTLTGLSSPIALAQLPVNEGMAIPFGTQLGADAVGDVQDAVNAPDSNSRTDALARLGTKVAMGALMAHGANEKEPQLQGPPSMGGTLKTPEGARPNGPLQTVEDPLSDVGNTAPTQGPTFQGIKDSDIPKAPKAAVPETQPEAERGINVSEEIRNNGAKTIADIQRLFPQAQLTREAARTLRNTAWGEPDANGVLPEQPDKPAALLQAAQPAKPSPVSQANESIAKTEPQEPPSQPVPIQTNVTPPVTQGGELPIDEPQAEPEPQQPSTGTTSPVAAPKPETAPTAKPEAPNDGSGDTPYGIAERVRTQREKAGTGPETQPGKVPNAEESVANGRKMIQDGVDPETALKNFEQTGQSKATDIALVRAQGEKLAKSASDAADSKGIDSPEYKAAKTASFDWDKRTKALQTDWAERGQAQQGHTDLDTGNFHELARAHQEATGKDFTPDQAKTAQRLSKGVKSASDAETVAKQKVLDEVGKSDSTPAQKSVADKISAALDKAATDAYARIRARAKEGRLTAGLDPTDLADHAIYGAAKIAKGAVDFGKWSAEMVKDLGDYVKPHLQDIWDAAKKEYDSRTASNSGSKKELTAQQQIWKRAKELLANGENDFDDIRHKVAVEMGLPVKDVTRALSENQSVKRMSDEMYRRMSDSRRLKQQAQTWLKNQQTPGWINFTKQIPRAFFAAKVFGHGTVGMITHAGLNVFNPLAWKTYWPEFLRQYPMAVKTPFHDAKAYHEAAMQDLIRDPNYITARRAGLANDPFKYSDDYQSQTMKSFIEKLDKINPISGSRGFDALKTFRQARFNQIWNAIPEGNKTPNMAKVIADAVNHSSGVVKTTLPEWMQTAANVSLFAPKLEMSRWAWLVKDPAQAGITLTNWRNATPEARTQAIGQIKEKAAIAGVYFSLLAANQGLLKAMGSKQSVNRTDPTKSDFLSFKVDGHKIGVVGPMIGLVRLFSELAHTALGTRSAAEKRDSRFSEAVGDVGQYGRGKASPFAQIGIDAASQADFRGQPLPFSNDKVPANLRKEGLGKYTWPKYATDKLSPIPFEEAIREVWTDQGMNESTQKTYLNALLSGVAAGATGIRYSRDFQKQSTGNR